MYRFKMLPSFIGFPSFTDWKTKSLGPSASTILYRRTARLARTSMVSVLRRLMRSITSGSTAIAAALLRVLVQDQFPRQYRLFYGNRLAVKASPLESSVSSFVEWENRRGTFSGSPPTRVRDPC
jgi:hypothetical protein